MRSPFSLHKRAQSSGKRPVYYVQFWNPEKKSYGTAKSIAALAVALGFDKDQYPATQRGSAAHIALAWLNMPQSIGAPKTEVLIGPYLVDFWTWDTSHYVKAKLARKKDSIGETYVANNLSWIKRFVVPELGHIELKALRPSQLEAWLMKMKDQSGLVHRTINSVLQAVRVALREALRLGLIDKDPSAPIRPLGEEDTEKGILTNAEVKELLRLEWKDQISFVAFCTALTGGLRLGEIQALKLPAIREDHIVVAHSFSKKVGLKGTKTN